MFGETIYLDNSAGTRLDERVLEAMRPYFFDTYAVATSEFGYSMGIEAREALDGARASLAARLGAQAEEFIFTSGSTESSNMAIKGVALALGDKKGKHLITSRIEDFPVLNTMAALGRQGFEVTTLEVDADGLVDPEAVKDAITDQTILVSIQHANQEIGTVQDIESIARICREKDVLFHTDATHTFTRLPLDASSLPVDHGDRVGSHDPRTQRDRWPLPADRHAPGQVDGRRLSGVQPPGRGGGHPLGDRLRPGGRAGDRRGDGAASARCATGCSTGRSPRSPTPPSTVTAPGVYRRTPTSPSTTWRVSRSPCSSTCAASR